MFSALLAITASTRHTVLPLGGDKVPSPALASPVRRAPITLDRPEQTHEPFFQDRYGQALDVDPKLVCHLQTVATMPVLVTGEVPGIFNVGLFNGQTWSVAERALQGSGPPCR